MTFDQIDQINRLINCADGIVSALIAVEDSSDSSRLSTKTLCGIYDQLHYNLEHLKKVTDEVWEQSIKRGDLS